jgi:hypothetical protein
MAGAVPRRRRKEHSRHSSSRKINAQNRLDSGTQPCRPEPRSISRAPE